MKHRFVLAGRRFTRSKRFRKAALAVSLSLLCVVLAGCEGPNRRLPEFDRAYAEADRLPAELKSPDMAFDYRSSRFFGEDARGHKFYAILSHADRARTTQCLAYFVGSSDSGVVCSPFLPVSADIDGLGMVSLYDTDRSNMPTDGVTRVGQYLEIEADK
jgi:hypothetical protein